MVTIIGVSFRHSGKVYYFDPQGQRIERGESVIVETAQGVEYGDVVLPTQEVDESRLFGELKPIIRVATQDDRDQIALNRRNEATAIRICRQKVADHGLVMKLILAEYAFDRSKLTFYFTADGRVDFRELVRDLASIFHTRIELRQVGVRDETRLLGGIGVCGRPLCCATWLTDFVPVSIKMAKEQNISLNSAKISGICGRLMCCLKNEAETYEYLNSKLPKVGSFVRTPDGQRGQVKSVNVLRQRVSVMLGEDDDEKEIQEFAVEELSGGFRKNDNAEEAAASREEAVPEDTVSLEAAEEEVREEGRSERRGRNPQRERGERNRNEGSERSRNESGGRNRNESGEDRTQNERQNQGEQKNQKDSRPRPKRPRPERQIDEDYPESANDAAEKKKNSKPRRYYKPRPKKERNPQGEA